MATRKKSKRAITKSGSSQAPDTNASPIDARDDTDPGDATARNYRYQHAFGVILLVAARAGARPYIALWCEQHEDLLAERSDGLFDAYQIKTSRPELGAWTLTDREVVTSVGRFVDLVTSFGTYIENLFFVSNTECDSVSEHSADDRRRGRCPLLFLRHLRTCASVEELALPYREAFDELQASCGCSSEALFSTLHRLDVLQGPSRGEIDASVSHEHLGRLDECSAFPPSALDQTRDNMVGMIHRASSLQVTDPLRHLFPVVARSQPDPALEAKRVTVADAFALCASAAPPPTQFVGAPQLLLGQTRPSNVLTRKLEMGGLADQVVYMKERERAAEYHLLEDAARRPALYPELLRQVEELVLGECSEAHLRARQRPEPYGDAMLIDVQDRLRRLADHRRATVGGHDYECLIGVVGLLTSECRVWWSARFQIDDGIAS